ncbi:hypothetical protein DY000_02004589 [Brassica cretica]|uniref:Uncharacterized protein n=1 Tax=Brassica cretica TaxID=69181 RepID=A0ABQ7CJR7_BRACR|nr:hypothetical protein DY000_02004589 [Brassica cretica]
MASMLTPFVPSPGSNRVTKSSPGAWLILRPDGCTWKPWGRLEAWREAGYSEKLGYSFELLQDGVATAVSASSSISLKNGGSFVIDVTGGTTTAVSTPTTSPYGSCDLGSRSSSGSRSGSGSDFGYLLPRAASGAKQRVCYVGFGGRSWETEQTRVGSRCDARDMHGGCSSARAVSCGGRSQFGRLQAVFS